MSGSRITIAADDRLDNVHPGDVLREDFLLGSDIPVDEVSRAAEIDAAVLQAIIRSERNVDAAVDARLTRYFAMSPGFFLRLQNAFDLEEVERRDGDALDRIVPRAA